MTIWKKPFFIKSLIQFYIEAMKLQPEKATV